MGSPMQRIRLLAVAAIAVMALASPTQSSTKHGKHESCRKVRGTFTNQFLSGADCPASRIMLCTQGQLQGDLEGDYSFNFTSMTPVDDDENPTVFDFTGKSTVNLDGGQLFSRDRGTIEENATGPSPFINHIHFVRGNGDFKGVEGDLTVLGEADLITGEGHGTYSGFLCVPERPRRHDKDCD